MTRAKDKLSIVRLKDEECTFVDEVFGPAEKASCPLRNEAFIKGNTNNNGIDCISQKNNIERYQERAKPIDTEVTKKEDATTKKQQREFLEKAEIRRLHEETGAYIGNNIQGKYEIATLEEITSKRLPANYFVEFSENHFLSYIKEGIKEYRLYGIKKLFGKMCYINNNETEILKKIYQSLLSTDPEAANVLEYLMKRAGIAF